MFDCEAVIIAGEGSEFRPKRYSGKFDLHQRAYAIYEFGSFLTRDYLFYYLEHAHAYFQKVAVGATVKSLRQRHFQQLPIRFPTGVTEQQRIVAILDQAFENIAKAKANAERGLINSDEIVDSYLDGLFHQIRQTASSHALQDICDRARGITYGVIKLGEHVAGGVYCLRTSNVRRLDMDLSEVKRISPNISADYSRTVLRGGELLINVRGTLGGVAVVPEFAKGWNVSREVAVAPLLANQASPDFVAYFVASRYAQSWLSERTRGAAYVGINLEDLRLLPVPVPERGAQDSVVQEIRSVLRGTHTLSQKKLRTIESFEQLKSSLLHQAFSGGL